MDRPILVSGPLIKPIQRGLKTDTRRTRDLDKVNEYPDNWEFVRFFDGVAKFTEKHNSLNELYIKSPYGQAGDLLWVRENVSFWFGWDHLKPRQINRENCVAFWYNADGETPVQAGKTRPSIHMPRWVSRITLELTDVTVERLHDITEEGAKREGVECGFVRVDTSGAKNKYSFEASPDGTYLRGFYMTWINLNGRESWYENPWVWVLSFKLIKSL